MGIHSIVYPKTTYTQYSMSVFNTYAYLLTVLNHIRIITYLERYTYTLLLAQNPHDCC